MENFFIEYRDPMLGLIVLIGAIFIIAFSSYVWGLFSKKSEEQNIENFIKKFDSNEDLSEHYKKLLYEFDVDINSLAFLAELFTKSGSFTKAINVYIIALKKSTNKNEKEFVLTNLGKVYAKAGIFKQANEVFFEALKLNPKNKEALQYLTVVYEKLKNYEEELEVLDVLQEQGVDVEEEISFVKSQTILQNTNIPFKSKVEQLLNLKGSKERNLRLILELFIKNKEPLKEIPKFPKLENCVDIIYRLNQKLEVDDNEYKALFYAKGLNNEYQKSKFFEINALSAMRKANFNDAELDFQYICKSCKHIIPLFFYRCPICYKLQMPKIVISIGDKNNEDDISLQ